MNRLLFLVMFLVSTATACFFPGGSCPPAEDLQELPVLSGDYSNPSKYEYGVALYERAEDIELSIDRESGMATLAFTAENGDRIEMDLVAVTESSDF